MNEIIEMDLDEDNEEIEIKSLEEEFKERYEEEYNYFIGSKALEEEETKRSLSTKSMPQLVDIVYTHKQQELLQTDALGSVAFVMGGKNFARMQDAKVLDDNQLETIIGNEKKTVAILHQPMMMTVNMRKYWVGKGVFWKVRYFFVWVMMRLTFMMDIGILRFNMYFVRGDGEYTIDPSHDWTPWELQRKLEAFLQLQGRLLKANIKQQLIQDQGDEKRFANLVTGFLIWSGVIIFMFLWVLSGA